MHCLRRLDHHQHWEALDAIGGAEPIVGCAVNLPKRDVTYRGGGDLIQNGCEPLAVTTPLQDGVRSGQLTGKKARGSQRAWSAARSWMASLRTGA